ncbi:hypothetical protein TNCV_2801241 [Trichonephila clavipes]|nr:hypothetical protein TNCV_2801241 [Trichonephila clavipes]
METLVWAVASSSCNYTLRRSLSCKAGKKNCLIFDTHRSELRHVNSLHISSCFKGLRRSFAFFRTCLVDLNASIFIKTHFQSRTGLVEEYQSDDERHVAQQSPTNL